MADNEKTQDPWLGEPRHGPGKDSAADDKTRRSDWSFDVLERLAFASIKEQRIARRWGIFFKLLFASYLLFLLFLYWPGTIGDDRVKGTHTALVEIRGVIADNQEASADNIITGLRRAFDNKDAEAIILRISSPGGSPVQAGYVNDEIMRLRGQHPNKKVYAVITDICASGGYYIAAAADEIYADKASIVGSIGVLMDGFGFTEALEKLGVERRLITAGDSKAFMDPFLPLKTEDVNHIRAMLDEIHEQFIGIVKQGRGERLANDDKIFTGLVWTGEESLQLGLVDGLGSSSYVARDVVGAERIVNYTYRRPYFERFADRLGVVLADVLMSGFRGEVR